MTHLQRVLFLSKRLNTTFRHAYFKCVNGSKSYNNRTNCPFYGTNPIKQNTGEAFHKQDEIILPTCAKSSLHSFNIAPTNNLEWMRRHFCTLSKPAVSENKGVENDKNVSCKNLDEISLSDPDLMKTFKELFQIYSANKYNREPSFANQFQQFLTSSQFRDFCNSLEKKLPVLSPQELKFLLQLDVFKVQAASVLMQKIYYLIILKINHYTPLDVISIYLKVHAVSHRKNSTSKTLKLVCERYFNSKLFENIYSERDYNKLAYHCRAVRLPLPVKKKLLEIISKNFHKIHPELSLHSLSLVLGSFSSEDFKTYFKPEMYDLLVSRMKSKEVDFGVMRNTLIGLQHLMGDKISYDEGFLKSLVEQTLAMKPEMTNLAELTIIFLKIGYLPWPLIHSLEHRLATESFDKMSKRLVFMIGVILSKIYFHPLGYTGDDANHIECLKKLDLQKFNESNKKLYVMWCLFLTVLGSEKKAEKLNEMFNLLAANHKTGNIIDVLPIRAVEAVITMNAFARKNFPDEVMKLPKEVLKKCHDVLKSASTKDMHDALGKCIDTKTALEYCTTSLHHCIDFAVLLGPDKKPMEIKINNGGDSIDGVFKIEDINKTPASQLVLYQIYKGDRPLKFRNSSDVPGPVRLYLETLEPFQCKVVLFQSSEYEKLNLKQRESYFVDKIRESMQ